MAASHKVLWHEGMLLLPQHFQQADRHHEAVLRQLLSQLIPHGYGLAQLAIDGEALAHEQFKLISCSGIMPDGTPFDLPPSDASPLSRPVGKLLSGGTSRLGVSLAIPLDRPGECNASDAGQFDGRPTRFRAATATVVDDHPPGERQEVRMAVRNLRLLLDGESHDGQAVLRLAELVRQPTGAIALAEDFIPPCLTIAASTTLAGQLKRTVDILASRSHDLSASRRQRTQGMVEFAVSESANLLLLHTVNGALGALAPFITEPLVHPAALYAELTRLAAQLLTFAGEGHPRELPAYVHDQPASCFSAMEARLRTLLETNIAVRYVPLPLTRSGERIHAARLPEAVLDAHRLYLSVQCGLPVERVMKEFPLKSKAAASGRLAELVAKSVRGMAMNYLSVPPGEIPAQPGCSYFEISRDGELWKAVADGRAFSIFVPAEFNDLKLELMAVKE
jgi:type VI secretion system protein ImpJ